MPPLDENAHLYTQQRCYYKAVGPYECLSSPWWVRTSRHKVCEPRHGCELKALNCGEVLFKQIQADIESAERTVDIITWGFDPGMVLVRDGAAEAGMRYGDLLKKIATRQENPVIVRLLVWHDDVLSYLTMKNNPGIYGSRFPAHGVSAGYFGESHERYNAQWYQEVAARKYPNISLHVRNVPLKYKNPALAEEKYDIDAVGWLGSLYAAHHQKMLLVDYELPKRAVGYVMGHNSTTDFWDTAEHIFQDPRRETVFRKNPAEIDGAFDDMLDQVHNRVHRNLTISDTPQQSRKQERLHQFVRENAVIAMPYQDVSLRVRGPILYDLNMNFCEGWSESQVASASLRLALWLTGKDGLLEKLWLEKTEQAKALKTVIRKEPDENFIGRRKKFAANAFSLKAARHSAQLLRTQPMHGEKGVKECYANLTRQMQHYIFIQNQYLQYEEWAAYLRLCVGRLRETGQGYKKPVYVFLLTSTPESTGMDIPTYKLAKELGHSHTMDVEHKEAVEKALRNKVAKPISVTELAAFGIYVVMGSLWACSPKPKSDDDYEEIYIHSKVAVVDDAAFTIGSANLNVRSMSLDSELNVLSQAMEIAFELRQELFVQSTAKSGPAQFGDMGAIFNHWSTLASQNLSLKRRNFPLKSQLVAFRVDRRPSSPLI
jgi:phosphatidylserine/phosphatidylglycerophosphate/cardiolipin synthase-like enzyme